MTTRTTRNTRATRSGFSLLEIMIVVVIMGLLAALVAPRIFGEVGKAKVKTTQAQIENLAAAVERFNLDMQRYPSAEEGLTVLLSRPTGEGAELWDGPYLQKDVLPPDGWGRAFEYEIADNGRFLIRSLGADGRVGGEGEASDLDNRS